VVIGASQIALGSAHTCALTTDRVLCWGANEVGQCGAAPSFAAEPTSTLGSWTSVHAGAAGTCTSSPGETWCWGEMFVSAGSPMHTPALDGASAIAIANTYGCALLATGSLACFGEGEFGNGEAGTCGDASCNAGETVASCEVDCGPAPLTHLDRTYASLATGTRPFTCGLRDDGVVECWGDNFFGQSGQTFDEGFGPELVHPVTVPFAIEDLAGCTKLAAGGAHACALCNGVLRCWGDARHGELGPPSTSDPITRPRIITPPDVRDPWIDVTAGDAFTCARTVAGRGFCWGRSLHGALGNGATGSNLPIAVTR
jgi:alpha-tubulin suppressor-like RCC1 family protein